MPKRSDAYMADRRRQILQAALGCIMADGWNRTTMDGLAAAAGVSKGAVYTHFASKRDLLIGLLNASMEVVEARAAIDSLDRLREEVFVGLGELAGPEGGRMSMGHMEAQLDGAHDPEMRAMLDGNVRRVVEVFTGIVAKIRPDLPASEARATALTVLLMLEGLRSYRAMSEINSEADMHALLGRQLDRLKR